jgi:uncharacterized protein (DUF169 family)
MDIALRDTFLSSWRQRFGSAELPLVFYYTATENGVPLASTPSGHRCIIGALAQVRNGRPLRFDADTCGCWGARRYLGFTQERSPNFEYFLSCGIPGKLEGERYKKSPELVRTWVANHPGFTAPAKSIVFKRWDLLDASDRPEVVIFFARPDVLSGLFTLANYDEPEDAVFAPFGAGCGSIVQYPYLEGKADRPRAVLGLFDVSARPYVPADTLSFAVPMAKFHRMIEGMEESFLTTPSWAQVRKRIG